MQQALIEQLKSLTAAERISQGRKLREEMISLLNQRIAEVQRERIEMNAQYDEEIANLQAELAGFGASQLRSPSDSGVKAYNYLKEHAGMRFQAGDLMRAIRSEGVVAAIVLGPFLEDGRIHFDGEKRGRVYWVEPTSI